MYVGNGMIIKNYFQIFYKIIKFGLMFHSSKRATLIVVIILSNLHIVFYTVDKITDPSPVYFFTSYNFFALIF